jgi:hypothetical protein
MKRQSKTFRFGLGATGCALAVAGSAFVASEGSPQGPAVAVSAPQAVATWKTLAASGRVEARQAEAADGAGWLPLVRGDELAPLSLVQTGHRGRATLARGGNLLILDPDSRVELPEASAHGGMRTSVMQPSGSVLYEVEGSRNPHFEVVTPYLVAGVKGTSFLVTVSDRYTAVTVERGVVEVLNSRTGGRLEVRAGESIVQEVTDFEIEHFREGARLSDEARRESRRLAQMDREFDPDRHREPRLAARDSVELAGTHAVATNEDADLHGDKVPDWVGETTGADLDEGDAKDDRGTIHDVGGELIELPGEGDHGDGKGGGGKDDDEGSDSSDDDDHDNSGPDGGGKADDLDPLDLPAPDDLDAPATVDSPDDPAERSGRDRNGRDQRR